LSALSCNKFVLDSLELSLKDRIKDKARQLGFIPVNLI
jgi:hypothetical protein